MGTINSFSLLECKGSLPAINVENVIRCAIVGGVTTHLLVEEKAEGEFTVSILFVSGQDKDPLKITFQYFVTPATLQIVDTPMPFGYACHRKYRENAIASLLSKGHVDIEREEDNITFTIECENFTGVDNVPLPIRNLHKYIDIEEFCMG